MRTDEGYTTPEGFWLARPLLLPDVRDFTDLVTVHRRWDHRTMSHTNGVVPQPGLVPDPVKIGENELGPYCSVRWKSDEAAGSSSGAAWSYGLAVTAKPIVVDVIAPRIVTDDDRLSFEVIHHPERDRCLVIAQHNHIIGSHWLAYVDPTTVPRFES